MGRESRPKYMKGAASPGGSGGTTIDTRRVMLLPQESLSKKLRDALDYYNIVKPSRKERVSLAPVPCLKRPIP